MADKLLLEDVRFYGQHGLTKAEQAVGAWFSVDAELALDLGPAAVSDDLGAAVDYGAGARRIVEIGASPRVNLIERLARPLAHPPPPEVPGPEGRRPRPELTPPPPGRLGPPAGRPLPRR